MTKTMAALALHRTDRTGIDWCHLMQSRSLKWFKVRFKRALPPDIDHSVAFLYKYDYYRMVASVHSSEPLASAEAAGHGGHSRHNRRCRRHHHLRGGERADRGGERRVQRHEIRAG